MKKEWTFSHKVAAGFAAVVALSVAVAVLSTYALQAVVAKKDRVIGVDAANLTDAERLHAHSAMKGSIARAYLLTRDERYLRIVQDIRGQFKIVIGGLRSRAETAEDRRAVDEIEVAEEAHETALQPVLAMRTANMPIETINARYDREALSRREHLDRVIDGFAQREQRRLAEQQQAATDMASSATRGVIGLTALAAVLAAAVAFLLSRALTRQISSAVHHVQSSSTELQAVAGQQATGAKEQASAMSEITTTISELLATSRQIAESAQRVADIADETAAGARSGDDTVIRSQDSLAAIRRQVELIVAHMLELGKKSQQVGVILEIINELAEQTNILAINATIEAAGAGESGKRFAVVADEIRKLADRVGASTKDIRALLDEVRSAVNTTVMATESGSKAVEAGARQFSELAAAFRQIVSLVGTTREAAKEIELSTKQQATAVEQVNIAVGNVAQATREAEASSGQALHTASQLATMSRDLARLVQPAAAA